MTKSKNEIKKSFKRVKMFVVSLIILQKYIKSLEVVPDTKKGNCYE